MTTETAPAAPQAVSGKEYQLLINGQWVAPKSGEMMERRYPANNDVTVAKFPKASEEDVDAATVERPSTQPGRGAAAGGGRDPGRGVPRRHGYRRRGGQR